MTRTALQRLGQQIQAGKLVIRLFLRYNLHAKLYLIHRQDVNNPTVGFLGSSNLTFAGLQQQGELNIDVLDHDACAKLQKWFNDCWFDAWCWDISCGYCQGD
jgi:phosphatidylserine/phosphatidylglycerophosphate/cardiolipin synthase-like enzyme